MTAYDLSGYKNHGTLTNMVPATDHVVTPMGRALDFDGSNDLVSIGHSSLHNPSILSVSVWFRNDATSDTHFVFSKGPSEADNTYGMYVGADGYVVATLKGYCILGASTNGSYTHAAFAYSNPNLFGWINGIQTSQNIGAKSFTLTDALTLGREIPSYPYWFLGPIANICIWNRAILPSEIRSLYTDPWGMYRLRRRVYGAAVAPSGNRRRRLLIAGARR